ncbi:hypothetical protein Tco_1132414 [Tanacetum coccineum]|uniref:Uncharacterized protein n=1 Tax=Tanacetum coccineum TaxID=301880 RepID=A0ABQ5JES1_9ASTR
MSPWIKNVHKRIAKLSFLDVTACACFVSALRAKSITHCAFSTSMWLDSLREPIRALDLTYFSLSSCKRALELSSLTLNFQKPFDFTLGELGKKRE